MSIRLCVIVHFILICFFIISLNYTMNSADNNEIPNPEAHFVYHTKYADYLKQSSPEARLFNRLQSYKQQESCSYRILKQTTTVFESGIHGKLVETSSQNLYTFSVVFLVDSTIRFTVNEEQKFRERFHPTIALAGEPETIPIIMTSEKEDRVDFETVSNRVILFMCPLKIEVYDGPNKNELVLVVNGFGQLMLEHSQPKTTEEREKRLADNVDSKPYGQMAVALDFFFPEAKNVYGLPMHADSLALKSTTNSNPYRLYNHDKGAYLLYNKRGLYGSIPFVIAHGLNGKTAGVFWLNAADTTIDITEPTASAPDNAGIDTYFESETGVLDVFLVLGPNFYDVTRQYIQLTGPAPMPPYFSIGYHQSRWNYVDENDVITVAENFDKHGIPLDAMWLDIEYTDAKKYFTWNPENFKHPEKIIDALVAQKRKLVVIIDPHIKRDPGYSVYATASERGFFVKTREGTDYVGLCWPGESSYLDFLNPQTREYYTSLYSMENFEGTTNDVFIWNDMNEPSVFRGPERTIPKDAVHYMNWEHRDIHNIYGFLQVMSTYNGLLERSNWTQRPFILTRSHFAGIQRYAAIWTGDTVATWDYLQISVPMCLSSALGGVSFCGADIGGFFANPNNQLITRWYQTGAYLPFFRGHAHIRTRRREPWLYDNSTMQIIREAITERQSLLPFWYTLFYKHYKFGEPVIRPVIMEFPTEPEAFKIDYEFLLGDSMLVRPVAFPDVTQVDVYFPGLDEIWYNKKTYAPITEKQNQTVYVTLNEIPVYFRSGYITPMRQNIKLSAMQTLGDPITLMVALDKKQNARGYLYIDDGESFAYLDNYFIYVSFEFRGNQLTSRFVDNGKFATGVWIEQVEIFCIPNVFTKAVSKFESSKIGEELAMRYDVSEQRLTLHSMKLLISKEWSITFE